jgi:hypothetical protein
MTLLLNCAAYAEKRLAQEKLSDVTADKNGYWNAHA